MRPRKRVLVFCAEEGQGALLRYRMELMHRIRATVVHTKVGLAQALLDPGGWEGMVHIVSRNAPNEHVAALMGAAGGKAKRLEIRPEAERELYTVSWSFADRVVWTDDPGSACPAIQMMMARKRGPKGKLRGLFPKVISAQELSPVVSSIDHH